MSVYSAKGKGWRYDFQLKGERYSGAWVPTKKEAAAQEKARRDEIANPPAPTVTGMAFIDLVNLRLDYVKAYHSKRHYTDNVYTASRWVKQWGDLPCDEIPTADIERYLLTRKKKTTSFTANKDLRLLRATFNWGMDFKRRLIKTDPTKGIGFFPENKSTKYVPPKGDVLKVIETADQDTQDYLWTFVLTLGRMSEINSLTWKDVDFEAHTITLYTCKKKGGHRTPRRVKMGARLLEIFIRRYAIRNLDVPFVFWQTKYSPKEGALVTGRYEDRKRIMHKLCQKAEVRYFRFHALRHFGATLLDNANVPIGDIQRILGHESRVTTEIYLHSITGSEERAMDVLDEALSL